VVVQGSFQDSATCFNRRQHVCARGKPATKGVLLAAQLLQHLDRATGRQVRCAEGTDLPQRGALFALEENDYVHINSIQRLEPSGDLLLSSRHLDTIFTIDEKTGDVKWMLGGKFSRATPNRPVGDPRGGFSHQHYARIVGNRLWVFDNGNLFPDLPSRAVA